MPPPSTNPFRNHESRVEGSVTGNGQPYLKTWGSRIGGGGGGGGVGGRGGEGGYCHVFRSVPFRPMADRVSFSGSSVKQDTISHFCGFLRVVLANLLLYLPPQPHNFHWFRVPALCVKRKLMYRSYCFEVPFSEVTSLHLVPGSLVVESAELLLSSSPVEYPPPPPPHRRVVTPLSRIPGRRLGSGGISRTHWRVSKVFSRLKVYR